MIGNILSERVTTTRYYLIVYAASDLFVSSFLTYVLIRNGSSVGVAIMLMVWALALIRVSKSLSDWWGEQAHIYAAQQESIERTLRWRDRLVAQARLRRSDPTYRDALVSQARDLNWQIMRLRKERGDYKERERWSFVPQSIRRIGGNYAQPVWNVQVTDASAVAYMTEQLVPEIGTDSGTMRMTSSP